MNWQRHSNGQQTIEETQREDIKARAALQYKTTDWLAGWHTMAYIVLLLVIQIWTQVTYMF